MAPCACILEVEHLVEDGEGLEEVVDALIQVEECSLGVNQEVEVLHSELDAGNKCRKL